MAAVQAMTGGGGWPMSVFLTPDGPAVLRRHLLPEPLAARPAVVPRRSWPASPRRGATSAPRSRVRRTARGRLAESPCWNRRRSAPLDCPIAASSTRPSPSSSASSTPRNGGWDGAPKFPQPMTIEFLLRRCGRGRRRAGRSRWRAGRSTRWPTAGSTTSSAAASIAMRPTRSGSCRTSRRCSTTTRSSPAPTPTPGRRPATSATADVARRHARLPAFASCGRTTARSPPARTPTPNGDGGRDLRLDGRRDPRGPRCRAPRSSRRHTT